MGKVIRFFKIPGNLKNTLKSHISLYQSASAFSELLIPDVRKYGALVKTLSATDSIADYERFDRLIQFCFCGINLVL